ncbi:MAG TPA: sigma 54-interacting transcriptional regulator [Kofleriaceae bacterium]|nr:sigma 54-interacting transcriptional regulator [Kofleriaceae bacterium]
MRVTRVTNQIERRAGAGSAHLRVIAGPDIGLSIHLPPVGVVVGADPGADVVLRDPAVSGRHCTVAPGDEGFDVRDLGSRNGTLLDGVAITQARVPVGAVLRLGRSLVQLMPAEESVDIPPSQASSFGELVGTSVAMRRVYAMLERAARSNASILFLGESGTGKELAARAVHQMSPRAGGPMVVFDCGAASETLIQSDLFGHVRGAFTGAHADRVGAFAAADAGTLFLDEIGDLPVALQPKLLRMLEAGEVIPVGARAPEHHDVRVVAATHRDLFQMAGEGGFRGDLFYRLAVVEVHLPPLRQRREDIPDLVRLFLGRAGSTITEIGGPNLERLLGYHWPGNVRELRNVVTRAVALSLPNGSPPNADFDALPIMLRPTTGAVDEPPAARADRPFQEAKAAVVTRFEHEYLSDLMRRADGNISQAARIAGLERKYLYRLLERAGLRVKQSD